MSPAQIHPSVEISRQMRKLFPPGKQAGPAHLSQAWMRARTPSRYPAMFPQRSQAKNNRRKKKALRRKPMKTTRPKCRRPRLLIITTQRQTMRNQRRRVLQNTESGELGESAANQQWNPGKHCEYVDESISLRLPEECKRNLLFSR